MIDRTAHDNDRYAGLSDPILERQNAMILAKSREQFGALMAAHNQQTIRQPTANSGFAERFAWARSGGANREPDPRADVAEQCGWPVNPSPDLLHWLYLTDSIAARVVEFMSKECWQTPPAVFVGKPKDTNPFNNSWQDLADQLRGGEQNYCENEDSHPLLSEIQTGDILSGIGSFGIVWFGIDDKIDPALPAAGVSETGSRPEMDTSFANMDEVRKAPNQPKFSANGDGSSGGRMRHTVNVDFARTKGRKLVFAHALPETLAMPVAWETNDQSPRFGWPVLYQVWKEDVSRVWSGSAPPIKSFYVHWTRVVHLADQHHHPGPSKVQAHPRMRCVLPEILDGRKISGSSGVSMWLNAIQKIFLESNPQLGGDVLFNQGQAADDFENMMYGHQQWMFLRGLHANAVAPVAVDPTPHQDAKIARICIKNGWPMRIFKGSERGNLASTQDETTHSDRVNEHQVQYETDYVVAPCINRLVTLGCLEAPPRDRGKRVQIKWPPVGTQDELKKAQVTLARTQAMGAAITTGVIGTFMDEQQYLTQEMDYDEDDADELVGSAEQKIADEERQNAAVADEHGFEKAPPPGFKPPEPPPQAPAPIKVKPGEKLVTPPTPGGTP